eukprot:UN11571
MWLGLLTAALLFGVFDGLDIVGEIVGRVLYLAISRVELLVGDYRRQRMRLEKMNGRDVVGDTVGIVVVGEIDGSDVVGEIDRSGASLEQLTG